MGKFTLVVVLFLIVFGCQLEPSRPKSSTSIDVYFSPRGGATDAIVDAIKKADVTIDVAAYSFTSAPIAGALVDAHRRGVAVRVVLDSSQKSSRYSSADFLSNSGVPVFIHDERGAQHSKYILIDGQIIITGSFNFSRSAEERNAENLLVLKGHADLSAAYARNFSTLMSESEAHRR